MEPEAREFLQRISLSLGVGLLWLISNSTFGIMLGWAYIYGHINAGNIIFYIWFVASIFLMIWLFKKLWKGKL
jgi:hypothetical protein